MTAQTKPPVVTGVVPYLSVSDSAIAIELYERAFGAEVLVKTPAKDGKKLMHCHLRINGGNLFLADAFPEYGQPLQTPQGFQLHLHFEDAEPAWKRAVAAGLEVLTPLAVQFWGDKYGELRDSLGVKWSIGG